jgi:hypothetical protein
MALLLLKTQTLLSCLTNQYIIYLRKRRINDAIKFLGLPKYRLLSGLSSKIFILSFIFTYGIKFVELILYIFL